jgi:lipoate-protein ligase B
MKLKHVHFSSLTSYPTASLIQEHFVARHLAYKAALSSSSSRLAPPPPQPPPTILTFELTPTYTAGRRERLSPTEISRLQESGAQVLHVSRGGQITFHGPGQLVAYPILDLKRHGLSARCYVRALEETTVETCGVFGVVAGRREDVGVWVGGGGGGGMGEEEEGRRARNICSVGVHMRRYVSSHGVGLNVATDTRWFDRIVACGLKGVETTTLQREGARDVAVDEVGEVWAAVLGRRLEGVDGVERIQEVADEFVTNLDRRFQQGSSEEII